MGIWRGDEGSQMCTKGHSRTGYWENLVCYGTDSVCYGQIQFCCSRNKSERGIKIILPSIVHVYDYERLST